MSITADQRDVIRDSIREFSRPNRTFWLMNALATVIACYGLLSNSAAVVIGAMVVALLLRADRGGRVGVDRSRSRSFQHGLIVPARWDRLDSVGGDRDRCLSSRRTFDAQDHLRGRLRPCSI